MKFKVFIIFVFFVCSLLPGIGFAQNKVVVIPLVDEIKCKCTGTLSSGGRWCDQGNGTVMDMSTCLVWLKKADWGGLKAWRNFSSYDDAHTRAGQLSAGVLGANLTDESTHGDWRLPTKNELLSIRQGDEPVTKNTPQLFTPDPITHESFWTSTTQGGIGSIGYAISVKMEGDAEWSANKTEFIGVWPVRNNK